MLKENKWYNFGDVNPREHGGNFVKIDGDEIMVVHTTNNDESGWNDGAGYTFQSRTESVQELTERFEAFKNGKKDEVGNFADWTLFIMNGWEIDEIVARMAGDILSYEGGDDYPETAYNYWKELRSYGIYPSVIGK